MDDSINSGPLPKTNPGEIPDIILDIAWRDILHLLDEFCNYEPGYIPLASVVDHFTTPIGDEAHLEINRLRENTHMPSTLARVQFDKWTAAKQPDDLLTVAQLDIVLHFTDILYTEFHMEIEMRTFEDKTMILRNLHRVNPQEAEAITQTLTDPFQNHISSELQQLQDRVMALTHKLSRKPRPTTPWTGRLPEANLHLVGLIRIDSPVPVVASSVSIP